jgi:protein subunit release factor A
MGSNGINVLSGNNSLQYVNQNSSIPMQGMIRIWGTDMQVFDGNSWQNIQSSYATVELATDTIALLQWVRDKKIEEEALLSLPSDHPAIKVAKQNLNKAKQEVKRLEEQLKITEILSKDEHETTTS